MVSLNEVAAGLPPTSRTYLIDSYLKSLETRLLRFVPETKKAGYLVAADTPMHPKGGAQPSDTGWIEGAGFRARIRKVLEHGGVIIHYGEIVEGSVDEGGRVRIDLDWEPRYVVMRLHTAGHIIDYAVYQLIGRELFSSRANHGPPESYLEYVGDPGELDESSIESLANETVKSSKRVYAVTVPRGELQNVIRGAPNILRLPDLDIYRVVVIDGVNAIPCGGTHVSVTSEVGEIRVERLERSEKGFKVVYSVVD